jgi:hypothetical protein
LDTEEEFEQNKYRKRAIDTYAEDGRIEIDSDALVSIGEDGAYVQAWVFVEKLT